MKNSLLLLAAAPIIGGGTLVQSFCVPIAKRQARQSRGHAHYCAVTVVTSPSLSSQQRSRAPQNSSSRTTLLENGDDETTARLWTYVHNFSKTRRQSNSTTSSRNSPALRPILYSFLDFFETTIVPHKPSSKTATLYHQALEACLIQALRAAGQVGDYRGILQIIETTTVSDENNTTNFVLLSPRVFGEAIAAMSQTSANASKLKQLWRMALKSQQQQQQQRLVLTRLLGAHELNVMIQALAQRHKIRAALDLYQQHSSVADAYTLSTLMKALADSVTPDQSVAKDWSTTTSNQMSSSPCWQYNVGLQILCDCPSEQLNNHVFASALRLLNERAGQVLFHHHQQQDDDDDDDDHCTHRHDAATAAMDLLQLMRTRGISPDVVTCSHVLSALDRGRQWKASFALLQAMLEQTDSEDDNDDDDDTWKLPPPNVYIYSSVISTCAKCGQSQAALRVLHEMRQRGGGGGGVPPNTWVYNAALLAAASGGGRRRGATMAMDLWYEMHQDEQEGSLDTKPDAVTYNTMLSALEGVGHLRPDQLVPAERTAVECFQSEGNIVSQLLENMKHDELPRDYLTYVHAVKAVRSDSDEVVRVLDVALRDESVVWTNATLSNFNSAHGGKMAVFEAALVALAAQGDLERMRSVLLKMKNEGMSANLDALAHVLIPCLERSGASDAILCLLKALEGDKGGVVEFCQKSGLGIGTHFTINDTTPILRQQHLTAAVTTFLSTKKMESASEVLNFMRERGLTPDYQLMQAIALEYCRMAMDAAAKESKKARQQLRVMKSRRGPSVLAEDTRISRNYASNAVDIALAMKDPQVTVLAKVATTCSLTGMWTEARKFLRQLHFAALEKDPGRARRAVKVLPALHRSLLKVCASKGNVTAAVRFVDDIQALSRRLSTPDDLNAPKEAMMMSLANDFAEKEQHRILQSFDLIDSSSSDIGMRGEDWKLLLIAASKSAHWRLCLCTLQFLRPFVEKTNPDTAGDNSQSLRQYEKLARSLTAAVLCFETRSQYAWAIRAIDDWIEWSGRRPPVEAVLSACRILAARNRGEEIDRLVTRVMQIPTRLKESNDDTYEAILHAGAISALHSHGLYEDADELFVHAYSKGHLSFNMARDDLTDEFTLDLHGMNVGMASSAVRIALQQQVIPDEIPKIGVMTIITGRGRNSSQRLRPILRPEVQRMLLEEFYPPLSTTSVPGNMGALRVPAQDVREWVLQQRQQRGARMLAIADIIKNLSSGSRIRRALESRRQAGDITEQNENVGDVGER